MSRLSQFRASCYTIEGINSFATAVYCNYLYFFFRDTFGFSDRGNLLLAAMAGFVYMIAAWQAGRFAQRRGCFTAMKLGFTIMAAALAAGLIWRSLAGQIAVAVAVFGGTCFIWPSVEALVSEGDTPEHVPHAVGLYNITWALSNATAFFIGGSVIKKFGYEAMFSVPLALILLQLAVTFWLEKVHARLPVSAGPASAPAKPSEAIAARARNFQRMAWVANPCAYVAINTLIAVLPGVAEKLHLSTMLAGFALSVWCFARFATFIVLWRWTGWHYRFRWLVAAFALLIASFATILVTSSLSVVVLAQLVFGVAIGLIYYSSLFYALDASQTKGEQGGLHEAAIGVGNCLGPAIGASALWLAPANSGMGAWAVSGLLLLGLGGMVMMRQRRHSPATPAP
ncbi:MAG TPA: MFS transporter [Candidatus Acidoferrales bacterium]|nr:MFS transporter [Candidatus Acidoferrales bacterium]